MKVFEKVAFHCYMSVSLTLDNVVACSRPMMVPNAVVCMCYPLNQLLDLRYGSCYTSGFFRYPTQADGTEKDFGVETATSLSKQPMAVAGYKKDGPYPTMDCQAEAQVLPANLVR